MCKVPVSSIYDHATVNPSIEACPESPPAIPYFAAAACTHVQAGRVTLLKVCIAQADVVYLRVQTAPRSSVAFLPPQSADATAEIGKGHDMIGVSLCLRAAAVVTAHSIVLVAVSCGEASIEFSRQPVETPINLTP